MVSLHHQSGTAEEEARRVDGDLEDRTLIPLRLELLEQRQDLGLGPEIEGDIADTWLESQARGSHGVDVGRKDQCARDVDRELAWERAQDRRRTQPGENAELERELEALRLLVDWKRARLQLALIRLDERLRTRGIE